MPPLRDHGFPLRTITGDFVLFGKLQFVVANRMGRFCSQPEICSRCLLFMEQVCRCFGAGVRVCWRKCAKRVMTCATIVRRMSFPGAGPHPKSIPAPNRCGTCAKKQEKNGGSKRKGASGAYGPNPSKTDASSRSRRRPFPHPTTIETLVNTMNIKYLNRKRYTI